jgi:hypothetical protein
MELAAVVGRGALEAVVAVAVGDAVEGDECQGSQDPDG